MACQAGRARRAAWRLGQVSGWGVAETDSGQYVLRLTAKEFTQAVIRGTCGVRGEREMGLASRRFDFPSGWGRPSEYRITS